MPKVKVNNLTVNYEQQGEGEQLILIPYLAADYRAQLTSTRFADRMKNRIRDSELWIFEECAHAAMYERVNEFNHRTLAFLRRHAA